VEKSFLKLFGTFRFHLIILGFITLIGQFCGMYDSFYYANFHSVNHGTTSLRVLTLLAAIRYVCA